MKLLDIDGPFSHFFEHIWEIIILSIVWFIGCLPIVTIGTSTTALFYVCSKKIKKESPVVLKEFWKSYKQNFIQSIGVSIILFAFWYCGITYFLITWIHLVEPTFFSYFFLIFILFELLINTSYIFTLFARYNHKTKNLFCNAFIFTHIHIFSSLSLFSILLILFFITYLLPIFILILPISIAFLSNYLNGITINKYFNSIKNQNIIS